LSQFQYSERVPLGHSSNTSSNIKTFPKRVTSLKQEISLGGSDKEESMIRFT
jgi:hypothetical protein